MLNDLYILSIFFHFVRHWRCIAYCWNCFFPVGNLQFCTQLVLTNQKLPLVILNQLLEIKQLPLDNVSKNNESDNVDFFLIWFSVNSWAGQKTILFCSDWYQMYLTKIAEQIKWNKQITIILKPVDPYKRFLSQVNCLGYLENC